MTVSVRWFAHHRTQQEAFPVGWRRTCHSDSKHVTLTQNINVTGPVIHDSNVTCNVN